MDDLQKLESELHNLLEEANVIIVLGVVNIAKATNLLLRHRECADGARDAGIGYEASEQRLRLAAESLERRIARAINTY